MCALFCLRNGTRSLASRNRIVLCRNLGGSPRDLRTDRLDLGASMRPRRRLEKAGGLLAIRWQQKPYPASLAFNAGISVLRRPRGFLSPGLWFDSLFSSSMALPTFNLGPSKLAGTAELSPWSPGWNQIQNIHRCPPLANLFAVTVALCFGVLPFGASQGCKPWSIPGRPAFCTNYWANWSQ